MDALSKPQLLDILRAARAVRERDFLMILVAFLHGLRASEVIAITRHDIRDGFLTVARLKGSMRTTQELESSDDPLLDERTALVDYMYNLGGNQRLFPVTRRTFGRIVERHGKTAGIPRHLCHPHALKHTTAMQSVHTAGVENVRQRLGHKSLDSTGAYLRVSDEAATIAFRKAIKG